jgi:hypothetical protein
MMELREKIEQAITEEPVGLFMKGTPQRVMCGNSLRALEALHRAGAPVTAVDPLHRIDYYGMPRRAVTGAKRLRFGRGDVPSAFHQRL